MSAAVARAEGGPPGIPSAISAYVELAPTASGPKPISNNHTSHSSSLSAAEQRSIARQGGADAGTLESLVTSSRAPAPTAAPHSPTPVVVRQRKKPLAGPKNIFKPTRRLLAVPGPTASAPVSSALGAAVIGHSGALAILLFALVALSTGIVLRSRRDTR